MGLMAVMDVMYRHPILFGSLLLLLTPSLFHILVYFSPLLISTSLFVVALISMGPHMEETREERERWAKGERPYYDDEAVQARSTTAAAESTFVQRWGFLLPGDPAAWVQGFEDTKHKLLVWIDNALKASASPLSPTPAQDDAVSIVLPSVDSFFAPKAVEQPEEDIPSEEEHILAASKDKKTAAAAKQEQEERPKSIDLDMPELEIIDEIEEPSPASTTTTTEASDRAAESSAPIFDEPPSSSAAAGPPEDREVPLDEPVSEALLPAEGEQNMPVQQEKIPATSVQTPSQQPFPVQTPSLQAEKIPLEPQLQQKIPSPEKRVHFNTAVASSPPPKGSPVKPLSTLTSSPRDVHGRILKDLHTRLNQLQEKRKVKHSEVLSRRMSAKQGRQASSGSSSD